jgi:PAS domain S-box-containing protein
VAGTGPAILCLCFSILWISFIAQPAQTVVFTGGGVLLCALSTRMHRALARTAQSERWYRQLAETSAEGIWVLDELGAIAYANPRMGEILGIAPGLAALELKGRMAEEFLFPEDLAAERVRNCDRRGTLRDQFDRRLRRKDGAEAWVLVSTSPLVSDDFEGTLSMMTDITERKSAEQALGRSEARFRSLFENVLEGVYQSTPQGRILAANPMLLRMLGLNSEAELNEVDIASDLYLDPDTRSRLLERLENEGSLRNAEYSLRRLDGHVIRVVENARVVRGEDGGVLYYEGTLSDITETDGHDVANALIAVAGYARLVLEQLQESHPAHSAAQALLSEAERAGEISRRSAT